MQWEGKDDIMRWCTCRGIAVTLNADENRNSELLSLTSFMQSHITLTLNLTQNKTANEIDCNENTGNYCLSRTDKASITDVPSGENTRSDEHLSALMWITSEKRRRRRRRRFWRVLWVVECWQGLSRHAPSWLRDHGPLKAGKHHDCLNQDKPRVQFTHLNTSRWLQMSKSNWYQRTQWHTAKHQQLLAKPGEGWL